MADTMEEYHRLDRKCLPSPDVIGSLVSAIFSASCVGASNQWRIKIEAVQGGGPQVQQKPGRSK